MEIEKALKELTEVKELSIHEILSNLLDGEQNLDLKTHIFKPKQLASLVVLGNHLDTLGYEESSNMIAGFIQVYLRYMVSFKRLSRTEIIKAVSGVIQTETKSGSPLTQNLK